MKCSRLKNLCNCLFPGHHLDAIAREQCYSVRTRFIGTFIATVTVGCVALFVVVPLLRVGFTASPLNTLPPAVVARGEENLTGLTLRGETNKEPFSLLSDRAYTLNKQQYLENPYIKAWMNQTAVRCWSREGVFDSKLSLLTLMKDVRVLTDSKLIIMTDKITIDAKNHNAWGNTPVRAFYIQSILRGKSFQYNGQEERLYISGPIHITVY
ncbi:MAG: LPS export ABC transporter periplasmic protein LptC [Holosporales bacterium]|jgi:hypothetical protein|nr:LPS export ABC transporter periplasmic protein LptC [Holosporales bacterium]